MPNLPRQIDDVLDSDFFEQAHGRNVSRIGQSAAQRDAAFEFRVVVVRRIVLTAAAEGDRLVHDRIERRSALREGFGVDVHLERAAGLAHGLRGAIEFRFAEIVAADHGLDFAGGVVDGEQRRLRRRLLLELHFGRGAGKLLDRNHHQIAHLQKLGGRFVAGPGEIGRREHRAVGADLDGGVGGLRRQVTRPVT